MHNYKWLKRVLDVYISDDIRSSQKEVRGGLRMRKIFLLVIAVDQYRV